MTRHTKVDVGDVAPDFTLPDQSGTPVRLQDLIGRKTIVLYFYPKDETPGCTSRRARSATATTRSRRRAPKWWA